MQVFIGADHRGFSLKQKMKAHIVSLGHEVVDCGNTVLDEGDDFPDFAFAVADRVVAHSDTLGVVICGSGGGVTMAANKVKGIRAAQAVNVDDVMHNRHHNDMNILALGSDFVTEEQAYAMVEAFLTSSFEKRDRSIRRLNKLSQREK